MDKIKANWDKIKETIRVEHDLSDVAYKTWILPLEIYKIDNNCVTILVKLERSVDYIKNKYMLPFRVIISEYAGEEYNVDFISSSETGIDNTRSKTAEPRRNKQANAVNLNPKYTFDTFVVGKNNEFANATCLAVAENPGKIYNPLFLYGGVGLGKTHLMHSIAHYVLDKYPDKKVLYVTSETFTNDLIEAIRYGKTGNADALVKFREKYRTNDVLLVDDIEFIIDKFGTQEEFFHTFNDLYSHEKAIIISSDKPPKDFDTLEERFRTRFEWGILADIGRPDFETRMAILRKKEDMDHLERYHIPNEVLEYIASNIQTNIRELEGSLNKLIALGNLQNKEINITLAQDALKDIISPNEKKKVTPRLILDIVSEHYHISVSDIISSKRNSEIVLPRQIIMYLCRKMTNSTYQEIGSLLGSRHHTTIEYGEKAIEEEISKNETLANTVDILTKKISPN